MTREEKIELLNKLLEIEEKNDIGNLTTAERGEFQQWAKSLEQEPTTKNDLGVDKFDKAINQSDLEEWIMETFPDWCVGDVRLIMNHMDEMPSVTPQESKTRYLSIDDVMSVFDDFMCGEVDEDGTETFLEMLKDKAESEDKE